MSDKSFAELRKAVAGCGSMYATVRKLDVRKLLAERDALPAELLAERDALLAERNALLAEREKWKEQSVCRKEHVDWHAVNDVW